MKIPERAELATMMAGLDKYWDSPMPQSVLKHELLRSYLRLFADKTGSTHGGSVGYIDGYAGAGIYRDRSLGSPLIVLQLGTELSYGTKPRQIQSVFVERNRRTFRVLEQLVGRRANLFSGSLDRHLGAALAAVDGLPLFMFVDPFGLPPTMDDLATKVLGRAPAFGRGRVATEILVNFASHTVKREGGHLRSEDPSQAQESTLQELDAVMDGGWWRPLWRSDDPDADRQLAEGWARRIEKRAPGYAAWSVPVPRGWDEDAYYYLVLVTSHEQGGWYFADAVPRAIEKFYEATNPSQLALFNPDWRKREAVSRFKSAIVERAAAGEFRVGDQTQALYARALGYGGEKELKDALRALESNDQIAVTGNITRSPRDVVVSLGAQDTLFDI